jgi:hypothetical protein
VFRARVDPDLLDAGTHCRHPLPVVRLESCCTLRSWKPTVLRALAGNALTSSREDPSQKIGSSTRNDYTNIDMSDQARTPWLHNLALQLTGLRFRVASL